MKNSVRRRIVYFLAAILVISAFLLVVRTSRAQSSVLFSDDFETLQPNSQFTLGSNDTITNTYYSSPMSSLQVSPDTFAFSRGSFADTSGQLYVQIFYETNATSQDYGGIITLTGNAGWISLYQHQPSDGLTLDWDHGQYVTNVFLTPNSWVNMTLSLYIDPTYGTNSSATLWLNGTLLINQSMPQVNGYEVNQIIFDPSSNNVTNNYDDIIVNTQSLANLPSPPSPIPSPTATPSPSPIPTPSASPDPTATPSPSPIPTPSASPDPTATPSPSPIPSPIPSSSPSPTSQPASTVPETTLPTVILAFAVATIVIFMLTKKRKTVSI